MKINSISGITCYVKDLTKTAKFYKTIGFRPGKQETDRLTFYVNWFFMTFIAQDREDDPQMNKDAKHSVKGAGLLTYIKVDNLDDYYKAVVSKRLKPDSEPQVRHGRREFVLRDPDGYKLLFFEKK